MNIDDLIAETCEAFSNFDTTPCQLVDDLHLLTSTTREGTLEIQTFHSYDQS